VERNAAAKHPPGCGKERTGGRSSLQALGREGGVFGRVENRRKPLTPLPALGVLLQLADRILVQHLGPGGRDRRDQERNASGVKRVSLLSWDADTKTRRRRELEMPSAPIIFFSLLTPRAASGGRSEIRIERRGL
jgi:hypothetical protein